MLEYRNITPKKAWSRGVGRNIEISLSAELRPSVIDKYLADQINRIKAPWPHVYFW
jgi:hypothetical protein